jgi:hypothetical protein
MNSKAMNTKVWIGFFAGAAAALIGSYVVTHRQTTPVAPAAAVQAVSEVNTPPVPAEAPVTRTVKKKSAPVAADLTANDPPPPSFTNAPDPQPIAQIPPAPASQPPAPQEPAASAPSATTNLQTVTPAPPPPVAPPVAATGAPVETAPEPPHSVAIAAGTLISVRLNDTLTTKRNQTDDAFSATLDQPLVVDGFVIAERGARVDGRVVQSEQAGRVKGVARLVLELTKINTADNQRVALHTESFEKLGPETKKEDAAKIGAGAVLGTIIGAVAGGGKGAAIGAGAGGAAGAGTVAATRGKPAELPVETRISFKLDQPVTITEQRR